MIGIRTMLVPGVLAASAVLAFQPAYAQDNSSDTSEPSQQKTTQLEGVIVTGTRGFPRTEADSLAPIDVLTPQDLQETGATNLATALRQLLPSFNFPQPSLTDATDATKPAQLRGLSPDETLVLINGKRQHTTAMLNINGSVGRGSSPVDLNAIPMNAIARVEVLRDGAAAQYGSDAIAGVINIILKDGAKHGSAFVTHGVYDGGQGKTWRGGADFGFPLGKKGWVRLSAIAMHQDPTNHAGPDIRYPGDPTYNTVTFHFGLARMKAKKAALNMQYDLTDNVQLYGFALFNKRNVSAGGFFRALTQYQDSEPAAVAVYPEGFRPIEHSSIRDDTEVLGLRGEADGWHWDVSVDSGGNHWKLHTADTFNYSLDAASPTRFYIGTLTNRQNIVNADFSKNFRPGWLPNPLTFAWGVEYRHQEFTIKHGDAASYAGGGAQVYPGFQPGDAGSHSRHNSAVYIDMTTDLTDKLTTELAGRFEHYSDFGNTSSWKLGARYAFNPTVALRGTVSTGFRAPSLQQEYFSSTSINFVNIGPGVTVPFTIRTFPVSAPAAIALGAQPLQPEESRNYGLGLVVTPPNGLYLTLDVYQIDIDNRINLSGNLVGPAVSAYLTSVGIPFVSGGRFFTNAVDTRTRGADLIITYPWHLASGALIKFTGGGMYNDTDVRSVRPNPPQLGLAGLTLPIFDREALSLVTESKPHHKTFLSADWSWGPWSVTGRVTRYGEFTVLSRSTPANDQTYGARTLVDVSASYEIHDITFRLGANNVTNVYPEKASPANNYHGIIQYPLTSPYGFNGAYYYGTVRFDW